MKKLIVLFIGVIAMPFLNAQDINDALRYSQDEIQGTARFRALSGAFGALGGDMSAVGLNPAGSSIFNESHASFSLSTTNTDNNASYFNTTNITSNSQFDFHQGGAAFVFNNTDDSSPWRRFTLSFAYDKLQNYDDDWFASGIGNNSISDYFINITENYNIPFGVLKLQQGEFLEEAYIDIGSNPNYGYQFQQAFLGYWSGVIDPVNLDDNTNDDNLDYVPNISSGNFDQEFSYASTGYNGKVSFNASGQYGDNLYLGVNLNSHFISYDRTTYYYEGNQNSGSLVTDFDFTNTLSTRGNGFSFQLGGILKLNQSLRVGATYNSPTWLRLEDETIQDIYSDFADPDIGFISEIINIFPEYKLQTPGKITGSIAYVGSNGLLSFDYSVKDYGQTKFKPTSDPFFTFQNDIISNNLKVSETYRIGGEYKHNQFSFRGGYRFEESPYINETTIGDLTGYSLGFGYNFGNTKLDVTFDRAERETNYQFYDSSFNAAPTVDAENTNLTLSLSFNI